jgi:pimeloyl-ACP methyl ester carboxylesterase
MTPEQLTISAPMDGDGPESGRDVALSPFGTPVTFDSFGGFYYGGRAGRKRRKAVLLLAPIGFEEMCARTTWRTLAEMISASGHACLRFDYPDTADAIEPHTAPDGISDWVDGARRCAKFLIECNPGAELVLVGQGFGASLAAQLGAELPHVAATVLMAPIVKGRSYLRELQAWTRVLTERIGIRPDPLDENGYSVAGFPLATSRATAIRAIDLTQTQRSPAGKMLLVERTHASGDSVLSQHFASLGADVTCIGYDGYELILTDPTQAEPPLGTLEKITSWIDGLAPGTFANERHAAAKQPEIARALTGPHYEELPFRFGPEQRLFGVLCRPLGRQPSAIAVLANSGRDYHIGWGRASVEQARALAQRGIASLRFDAIGIGDSPAAPGASREVIYSEEQIANVCHAIDYVEGLGCGPITLVGRCSGAYASFNAAVRDPRVRGAIIVNAERFVWDPRESVEEALRYAHRSIGNFGATLLSKRGIKRLLSGELRFRAAATYVAQRLVRQAGLKLGYFLPGITPEGKLYKEVHRRFQELERRGVRVALVFSTGDLGLHEFRTYMGESGERLERYKKASVTMIPDADHNFTHSGARARLTEAMCDLLISALPPDPRR